MEIIKIMILGVTAVLICGYLKSVNSAFHQYVALSVCLITAIVIAIKLSAVITGLSEFTQKLDYGGEYAGILLKTVLITYATSFTSDICKDSGYSSMANIIELFGKISIIVISMPIIFELLDLTAIQAFGADLDLTQDYSYDEIENAMEKSGIDGFSFADAVGRIVDGEFGIAQYIKSLFTDRLSSLNTYRSIFVNIMLLCVLSGLIKIMSEHRNINNYDTARLIIMSSLIIILAKIYNDSLAICIKAVSNSVSVYEAVIPVFMSAVAVISGSVTYAAYYQVILMGVTVVNIIFLRYFTMLIRAQFYLTIINKISNTDRFGKLSELIENFIKLSCRLIIVIFTGLSCVKGIMSPMSDSLKRQIFYKSAKIIPGVGDSLEAVSSALYGSGIIIKNGIGIAGIIAVLFVIGAPLIQIAMNFIMLKIAAALLAPIADAGLVGALDKSAGVIGLMMSLVAVTGLLFIIMIGLICAATNSTL